MNNSRTVYSTETGKFCSGCGKALSQCVCKSGKLNADCDGIIRVSRETKGRKGKSVTLIKGYQGTEDELKFLGKRLKQLCGTGGTVKNGVIEIQGDVRQKIFETLKNAGHSVK